MRRRREEMGNKKKRDEMMVSCEMKEMMVDGCCEMR